MRIVGIDPGGTTGYAELRPHMAVQAPFARQFDTPHDLYVHLEGWAYDPAIYIVETFTPRPGARSWEPEALYINGYVQGRIPFWHHESRFVAQSPAQAKSFATNDKLRKLGWWVPGQDHARDALRHLLTFLCTSTEGRTLGGETLMRRLLQDEVYTGGEV